MEDILEKIDIDKQSRIINSALEEFSKNSFSKASTNNIVKNAGISKGLLYHYFGTKKNLYEFLKEFTIRKTIENIEENINWQESDLLLRLKEAGMIKLRMTDESPYLFNFFSRIFENSSRKEMEKIVEEYSLGLLDKVYIKNIDYSLFKDDMDREKILHIINWTFEKYGEETMERIRNTNEKLDYKAIGKDIDEYIKIFRKTFYKEEIKND